MTKSVILQTMTYYTGIQRGGVDKLLAINSLMTAWGSELRQYMFNAVFKYLTSKPVYLLIYDLYVLFSNED